MLVVSTVPRPRRWVARFVVAIFAFGPACIVEPDEVPAEPPVVARAQTLQTAEPFQLGAEVATPPWPAIPARVTDPRGDVASAGDQHLVVWTDGSVHAARVGADGQLLDTTGVFVGAGWAPRVTWDGTGYVIVWTDRRPLAKTDGGAPVDTTIMLATRMGRDGVVDGNVQILGEMSGSSGVAINWNGKRHLLAWVDSGLGPTSRKVMAIALDAALKPAVAGPLKLGEGDIGLGPVVVGSPGQHLVLWSAMSPPNTLFNDDLFAARVTDDGAVLDPVNRAVVVQSGSQVSPHASWDGTRYLITYRDVVASGQLRALRMGPDGALIDATAFAPMPADALVGPWATGAEGAGFRIIWRDVKPDPPQLRSGLLAGDPPGPVSQLSTHGSLPAQAQVGDMWLTNAPGALAVWSQRPVMAWEMYATRPIAGAPTVRVSNRLAPQVSSALASNGRHHLFAWLEEDDVQQRTFCAGLVDLDGRVAQPSRLVLGPGTAQGFQLAAGWNGQEWMLLQAEGGGPVRATRIGQDGAVIGVASVPIVGTEGLYRVAVAGAEGKGGGWLIVGSRRSTGAEGDIFAGRLAAGTAVLESALVPIAAGPFEQKNPALAWNGSSFTLVWQDLRDGQPVIAAARIGPGPVTPPAAPAVVARGGQVRDPAVAARATGDLVAWVDGKEFERGVVRAVALDAADVVVRAQPIELAPGGVVRSAPAVTAFSEGFIVAWQETVGIKTAVVLARIDAAGARLDALDVNALDGNYIATPMAPLLAGADRSGVVALGTSTEPSGYPRLRGRVFRALSSPGEPSAEEGAPELVEPSVDAAVAVDVPASVPATRARAGGCGCRVADRTPPVSGVLALGVAAAPIWWALWLRRRRKDSVQMVGGTGIEPATKRV
jgi:hypothetical protein